MIKVTVKNLGGQETNVSQFESDSDADLWINTQTVLKSFGKPERWIDSEDLSAMGEDRSKAVASQDVGGPDDLRKQYKFAAEFSVTKEDITAQIAQAKTNEDSLAYLNSTDWMIIRQAETGISAPAEVLTKRSQARASIVKA
jgi:hypothetical protein